MKKVIVLFLISLLLFTAGCGKKAKDDGIVTLKMWMMPNSQEPENDLYAVLEPFLKANPNIKIEIASLDWGAAWPKLTTAASSSTDVPDIVQIGTTWLGAIASMGALEDLTARYKADGLADKYVPLSKSNIGYAGSGQVSSLPWIIDIRAMFYRTDVLARLGLTAADLSTWDKLDKSLAKIKKAKLVINGEDVAPLGITGKNDWNLVHNVAPWIWMSGGSFISKNLKKSDLGSKASVDGLNAYIDFVRKGYVPLSCLEQNSAQVSSGFNNGLYAVYFDGPYALRALTLPPERGGSSNLPVAKNFGLSVYPKSPSGKIFTYGGGSNLAMFKVSKHKDEAWELIKFLSLDKDAQITYSKLSGFMPVAEEAINDPYFTKDPYRKVFADSVRYGRNYPAIARWARLETGVFPPRFGYIWNKVVQDPKAFTKEELAEELKQTQQEINTVLGVGGNLGSFGSALVVLSVVGSIFLAIMLFVAWRIKKKYKSMRAFYQQTLARKVKDFKKYKVAYYFMLPAVLGMLLMHLLPILQGIYMAFLNLNQFTFSQYLAAPFVGFKNFYTVLFDPSSTIRLGMLYALRNTFFYAIVVTFGSMALAMCIALMLNRSFKGRGIVRTLFLFSWVVPSFVVGILFGFMWQRETGIINIILYDWLHIYRYLPISSVKPFWLMGTFPTFWAIVIPTMWRGWPLTMLLLLAGLQGISQEYYEAADIDGANGWQKFWNITFPLLRPVWAILMMFGIIFNVYSFNIVYMMFGNGAGFPGQWGDLMMTNIFRNAFLSWDFGIGAAVSFMLMIMMFGVMLLWYRYYRKVESEQ